MKHLLFIFFVLVFMTACEKDEENGGGTLSIKEIELPSMTPVIPGFTLTIKGKGFTFASHIWLQPVTGGKYEQASITGVDATGISFIAPRVYDAQNVFLQESGEMIFMGMMIFAAKPEKVAILPQKITKVIYATDKSPIDTLRLTYDANGKIATKRQHKSLFNYVYTENQITGNRVVGNSSHEECVYKLADGKVESFKRKDTVFSVSYSPDTNLYHLFHGVKEHFEAFTFNEKGLIGYSYLFGKQDDRYFIGYDNLLNRANIDIFYFLSGACWDSGTSDIFLLDIAGKRSGFLPSQIVNENKDRSINQQKYKYVFDIGYEMAGEYVKKMTIKKDYQVYRVFEFFYE